jgi:hypothetical protein
MFALIETNQATHIAIHIPKEGAEKSIPALVGMLENNATFIKKSYGTLETCKPDMKIHLGEKISVEGYQSESELVVVVPESDEILDGSFVLASPAVFVSNQKGIEKKDAEIKRLRAELEHVKQQLLDLQNLANKSEDEE